MTRSVPEWIGKTDDTPAPKRVRLRVYARDEGRCQCGACGYRLIRAGEAWQTDHYVAIINGGANRETNLRTLLVECHARKTGVDVAEKSMVARVRAKHLGLHKARRPIRSRGFQRSETMKEKTTKADALRAMRESGPARIGPYRVATPKSAPKKRSPAKKRGRRC